MSARRRVSVVRHARLLDYRMHEGCNARVWVQLQVDGDFTLEAGTPFLTRAPGLVPRLSSESIDETGIPAGSEVFESMHEAELFSAHHQLSFYAWGNTAALPEKGGDLGLAYGPFSQLKTGRRAPHRRD